MDNLRKVNHALGVQSTTVNSDRFTDDDIEAYATLTVERAVNLMYGQAYAYERLIAKRPELAEANYLETYEKIVLGEICFPKLEEEPE